MIDVQGIEMLLQKFFKTRHFDNLGIHFQHQQGEIMTGRKNK